MDQTVLVLAYINIRSMEGTFIVYVDTYWEKRFGHNQMLFLAVRQV